jgi:hypothetical protein
LRRALKCGGAGRCPSCVGHGAVPLCIKGFRAPRLVIIALSAGTPPQMGGRAGRRQVIGARRRKKQRGAAWGRGGGVVRKRKRGGARGTRRSGKRSTAPVGHILAARPCSATGQDPAVTGRHQIELGYGTTVRDIKQRGTAQARCGAAPVRCAPCVSSL